MAKRPNIKKHTGYTGNHGLYEGSVGYPGADYYSRVFYVIFKTDSVTRGRGVEAYPSEFKWVAQIENSGAGFRHDFRKDYPKSIVPDQFLARTLDDVQAMLLHMKAELRKYHNFG